MDKEDTDYYTIQAMLKYGGSFVKALAVAFECADPTNFRLLKNAFKKYWVEYHRMGLTLKQKEYE